jgi:hypothetical protein
MVQEATVRPVQLKQQHITTPPPQPHHQGERGGQIEHGLGDVGNLSGDPKPWGLGFHAIACAGACEDPRAGDMEEETGPEPRR